MIVVTGSVFPMIGCLSAEAALHRPPALHAVLADSRRAPLELQMAQVAERLRQKPRGVGFAQRLVVDLGTDVDHGPGLAAAERDRLRLTGVTTPAWIGPNAGLRDNLPRMLATFQHAIPELWAAVRAHTVLAISWLSDAGFSTSGVVGPYAAPITPAARDERWPVLGYDVGDGSLLSGLMNCGYGDEERAEMRARWGHRLNDAHLFHTAADAFAFRALSNARTRAHAPFFVYGLYAVADVSGS